MIQPILNQPAETRTVMEHIRWETYVDLAEQRHGSVPRMTYDEGVLELMSPRRQHESLGRLLGRLVETYSEVREIEIQSVASTTFKRSDLSKGFEADESYYIEHADQIRVKEELDLSIDPPPDLVIEIEITRSAIEKMKLFAAMGVPEVWQHDGSKLGFFRLLHNSGEVYENITESVELPGFTVKMAEQVLAQRLETGENALIAAFRKSL